MKTLLSTITFRLPHLIGAVILFTLCYACSEYDTSETLTYEHLKGTEDPEPDYRSDMPYNLNVVYFYPKGTQPHPKYQKRLSGVLTFWQEYLADELASYGYESRKFGLLRDVYNDSLVKIIPIEGQYEDYRSGSQNIKYIAEEVNAYFAEHPEEKAGPHTAIFQRGTGNGSGCDFNPDPKLFFTGINNLAYLIDYEKLDMKYFRNGTTEGDCLKVGSNMHELLHSLNVPHDRERYNDPDNFRECIMSGGGGRLSRQEYAGKVHITKAACAILDKNPIFQTTASPYYTSPEFGLDNFEFTSDEENIYIKAHLESTGAKPAHLAVYHDKYPAWVNNDYDAINWTTAFDENGNAELTMPLAGFYPDMREDWAFIRLKLRIVFEDGTLESIDNFGYFMLNGKPLLDMHLNETINEMDKSDWQVTYIKSEQTGKGKENLIDNDRNTFWHSEWWGSPQIGKIPQDFIVDLGAVKTVNGFTFVQRQQTDPNNSGPLQVHIKNYTIEISTDQTNWTKVGNYSLQQIQERQIRTFADPLSLRYVRITMNSTYNKDVCALAEFGAF
ncbi:discoidin domain-containing protein [Zhouia amylolytica]|uniref:discoidin domain-containing protein n=1 Tax=Zhouia amylolytica TaxID=376730 RepID=UPI0020CCABE1|nr:discoidin domain-containing protein [Zhouia amylolytica]MCQ0112075.1 discoidin domain-containing protein [Zhouia amylolytica]